MDATDPRVGVVREHPRLEEVRDVGVAIAVLAQVRCELLADDPDTIRGKLTRVLHPVVVGRALLRSLPLRRPTAF